MKRALLVMAMTMALALSMLAPATADGCTEVDTSRGADGPQTAALVNPGEVTGAVDGADCDIAVYFDEDGSVEDATIAVGSGEDEQYSVFVDGADVDITDSTFGDDDVGDQDGEYDAFVHVLYANGADGTIAGNHFTDYVRGAIVAGGNNVITGEIVGGEVEIVDHEREDALAERLVERYPQYRDRPFTRVLALRIVRVTGWAAG